MRPLIAHRFSYDETEGLEKHLTDVGVRAASIITSLPLELCIDREDLSVAAYVAGICHDFGKAKNQFQDYIWTGKNIPNKQHALISSIFTYLVSRDIFKGNRELSRWLPFACSYAVNRHHGSLVNLDEAFSSESLEREYSIARDSLDERVWNFEFAIPKYGAISFASFRDAFSALSISRVSSQFEFFRCEIRDQAERAGSESGELVDQYLALLSLVSTLTESDVATTIGAPIPKPCAPVPTRKIESYLGLIEDKGSVLFKELRGNAWKWVSKFSQKDYSRIFRMTLPTGIGKTLMGLYTATRLQRAGYPLIYSLPYLSIIEQVGDITASIFSSYPDPIRVMQHHSLTFPQASEYEEKSNFEQAQFTMEDWDSDLVVTTFDQLFYSFLSARRSFIRRFCRLPGSTIILDEVQTVPPRILPLIETFIQKMAEKANLHVLYMTATKPRFLTNASKIIPKEETFFAKLGRTKLILQLEETHFRRYLETIAAFLRKRRNQTTMFTVNTVRCSLDLLEYLMKLRNEPAFSEMKLFYISGAVAPIERINRINKIKEITKSSKKQFAVLVTTQCVEAGVDIDVDEAIRDFAPWDSLMQLCGRANRYGSKPCASVWVNRWVDDTGRRRVLYADYVYDKVLLDATLHVLRKRRIINESHYYALQDQYIKEVGERISDEQYRKITSAALAWKFSEVNEFRRIFREGDELKTSVFCIADNLSEQLKTIGNSLWVDNDTTAALSKTQKLIKSEDFKPLADFLKVKQTELSRIVAGIRSEEPKTKRFHLLRMLRPMFQAYTISITEKTLEGLRLRTLSDTFSYLERAEYESLIRLR